jgi:Protein of unknown function (DUF2637)
VQLPQLRRIRWAVRAALTLGVAASVVANVLHARPNPISQAIAAWPPLALLLTVELTSRIPMHRWTLAACRVISTVAIAGIAAWVSYWHMQDVATRYGETTTSAYLLPISVDGLIVVASVSLVELAGRIRLYEDRLAEAAEARMAGQPAGFGSMGLQTPLAPTRPLFVAPHGFDEDGVAEDVETLMGVQTLPVPVSPAVAPSHHGQPTPLSQPMPVSPAVVATTRPAPAYANGSPARQARAAVSSPARTVVTAPTTKPADPSAPRPRRPVLETAELADAIEAMHPEIDETELARQLGITPTRLRAVRREARENRQASTKR